jgi:hypothetical protein
MILDVKSRWHLCKKLFIIVIAWNKRLCNKLLTLRFGCEHEGVLRFQGKMVFPIFGWECLHTTIMETRKNINVIRWCLWLWCFSVIFLYLGWVCCCGYYWTLAECVAKELLSKEQLVEILLWNGRKKNSKVDKWQRGGWICLKERFLKEGRLHFWSLIEV